MGYGGADLRRYYDRQTAGFVAFGQGGRVGAIHRAVWAPGVRDREQAFHYVEDQIAELVRAIVAASGREGPVRARVLDLGCGVGGSLCYLAERVPVHGTGITISPVQAGLARERVEARGLAGRVTCIEGDYCRLPDASGSADLAYAIESFVHAPSAGLFLAECARVLRPGGRLVVCDDFLRPTTAPAARRAIEQFRRGWHVNTLVDAKTLTDHAEAAGLSCESITDLSPHLELGRPRDRAIAGLVAVAGRLLERTVFGHLVGGSALQRCLAEGWLGYDLLVFRRTSSA